MPDLRDRLHELDRLDVPDVMHRARGIEHPRAVIDPGPGPVRRGVTAALVLAAAMALIVYVIRPFDRSPDDVPLTPSPVPLEERVVLYPLPEGVQPRSSFEEIEAHVLEQIEDAEAQAHATLAPPKVVSIRYVPADDPYAVDTYGLSRYDDPTWLVTFEGTQVVCASWCSGHPGGTLQFPDGRFDGAGGSSLDNLVCAWGSDLPRSVRDLPDCDTYVPPVDPIAADPAGSIVEAFDRCGAWLSDARLDGATAIFEGYTQRVEPYDPFLRDDLECMLAELGIPDGVPILTGVGRFEWSGVEAEWRHQGGHVEISPIGE